MLSRRRVFLKPGRERPVLNRHPWIFEGAVAREEGAADAPFADVFDSRGALVASGFYSKHSQIRVRALTIGVEASLDTVAERLDAGLARRRPLANDPGTTAYRLIHSEGDDLSGLIVDQYEDTLVVEITSAGLDLLSDEVIDLLRGRTGARSFYLKNDLPARRLERLPLEDRTVGDPPRERVVLENGLRFRVQPGKGQKTGFFLDQRENRALVGSLSRGREMLNLFAYSGGFGVYAAGSGASSIEEVDVSAAAIDLARANHEMNGSADRARLVVADAFEHVRALGREGRSFDLVVCDPPAFARSRGEVQRAARGYKDINLHAMRLIRPGGSLFTFSCSGHMDADLFQKIVFSAALDAERSARFVRRLGAGPDHPVSLYCPEGEYLKGLWVVV